MKTRINVILYIFCFLLSLSFSYLARADDFIQIPAELRNKEFLEKVKWTDATFFQKITSSWDKYTGKQDIKGKEILREKEIQIYGTVFSVQARRFSDGTFEFAFDTKDSFSKDFQEKFLSYAIKTWGTPLKSIDNSWRGKEMSTEHHEMEWLLKNTHIKITTLGTQVFDSWVPHFCILLITQEGKYVPLKDPIALKCEGQKKLFGLPNSAEITPVSAFIVLVDLNRKHLLRRDKSSIGEITEVTEEHFISEWTDKTKGFKHRFFIDRKLGTYEWKTTSLESGKNYGMVDWGNCEKIDLELKQKF